MRADLHQRLLTALGTHQSGDLDAAEAGYRGVLSDHPDQPDALHYLGMIAFQRGDSETALDLVRRGRAVNPADPSLAANLGLVLQDLGRHEDAENAYMSSLELDSAQPEAWYNLGLVRQLMLNQPGALNCFGKTLAIEPGHVQARQQLGVSLLALGDARRAVDEFRSCLASRPDDAQLHFQLGVALARTPDLEGSVEALRRACAGPDVRARALASLSTVLRRLERHEEALAAARSAVSHTPSDPDALRSLGHSLKAAGRLKEAGETYRQAHSVLREPGSAPDPGLPTFVATTRSKLRHDAEQLEWLVGQDVGQVRFPAMIDTCHSMITAIGESIGDGELTALPRPAGPTSLNWYNRCLHIRDTPAIEAGALRTDLDRDAIQADYQHRHPGITWIDDFLKPAALNALRRFCLESTIWYDCDHPNGYLGAYLQDGFACPLLLQIATELAGSLPDIFAQHRLMQLWAYKYDSRLSGIDIHADFAAINVNFWITPNDANLDPESGGMVIWDVEAPLDWTMDEYNTYDPVQQDAIRTYLREHSARRLAIPHRQNRCVVFNSNLLHRTDDIHFRDGYENRRINITMLFGHRDRHESGAR